MKINKRSFAAGAASVVVLGAALVPGFAAAQSSDANPTATPAVERGQHAHHGGLHLGRHFGFGIGEELATELGISLDELRAAVEVVAEEFRPAERPVERPTEEEREAKRAEFKAALADELGISSQTLDAAIETVKAAKQAEAIERVQQKVTDGVLTQAEADVIIERIENGERPFPHRGRFGGPRGGGFGGTSAAGLGI